VIELTRVERGPGRARYWVVVFAATLAFITYIDRVAIAQAAPFIADELRLTPIQMGYILAAFDWSYALFEVPSGWLGDRIGAKSTLTRIVVFWSTFTAATAWAWSFVSLFVIRLLFGAGESGCFPNLTKTFKAWLSVSEQARAQAAMWMSARLGGAFAPYFVFLMFQYVSWRSAFVVLGVVGSVWSVLFFRWYKDKPGAISEKRVLRPKSRKSPDHVAAVPWKQLLTSKALWLLSLQYFCLGYGWQFYVTWLPTYLIRARQLPVRTASLLAGLPLLVGAFACAFSGMIYPRLIRATGTTQRAWCIMAYVGFCGSALFLFASLRLRTAIGAVLCMALASFSNDLALPGSWAAVTEVGGSCAGTTSAFMNMMSSISGSLEAILTGYIVHWTNGNWQIAIYTFIAVYICGFLCWLRLGSLLVVPV
jgi:MFS transporter, ACS family, glucarate transporter